MNNIIPRQTLNEQRDREIAAWLLKKAHEYPSASYRQEAPADLLARMASKLVRGAVRDYAPIVDRETARHVLHMFGHDGGYPPGDYMGMVYTLIARSDVQTAARLAIAFPAQAEAVRMASYDNDGIAKLTTIAAGGAS